MVIALFAAIQSQDLETTFIVFFGMAIGGLVLLIFLALPLIFILRRIAQFNLLACTILGVFIGVFASIALFYLVPLREPYVWYMVLFRSFSFTVPNGILGGFTIWLLVFRQTKH